MNKFPVSTIYFCGHCEDEVVGMPAGSRIPSGRPLCARCTEIGVIDGWGKAAAAPPDSRIYESPSKRGIIILLFLLIASGFAFFFVILFSNALNRR